MIRNSQDSSGLRRTDPFDADIGIADLATANADAAAFAPWSFVFVIEITEDSAYTELEASFDSGGPNRALWRSSGDP